MALFSNLAQRACLTSILLATIAVASPALAVGGGSTGGGKGVVCRTADGSIKSVEVLDLWEAREIFHRAAIESSDPVAAQVAQANQRLKHAFWVGYTNTMQGYPKPVTVWGQNAFVLSLQSVEDMFLQHMGNVQPIHHVQLELTPDSFEIARPFGGGCNIEQIVRYEDDPGEDIIYINEDIFDAMSKTQQAALIVHEAVYKYMRERFEEANSIRVRRAIGGVFSGLSFPSFADFKPTRWIPCVGGENTPDKNNVTRVEIAETDIFKADQQPPMLARIQLVKGQPIFSYFTPIGGDDLTRFGGIHSADEFMTRILRPNVAGSMAKLHLTVGMTPWAPNPYDSERSRLFAEVGKETGYTISYNGSANGHITISLNVQGALAAPQDQVSIPLRCYVPSKIELNEFAQSDE